MQYAPSSGEKSLRNSLQANANKLTSRIFVYIYIYTYIYIIQIYSGITCGRVLNGELYTCKLYKLINLCWSTGCFVKLHFTPEE